MARINRTDVIQKAVNDLALSTSDEIIPNQTLDKVQCTYSLNKQFSTFVGSVSSIATGTMTLTPPSTDPRTEIYLTSIDFDMIKDAVCDLATGVLNIQVTPDQQGIARTVLSISVITLTAQTGHAHVDFAYPLKIQQGTSVTCSATTSLGVLSRSLTITGFRTSSN